MRSDRFKVSSRDNELVIDRDVTLSRREFVVVGAAAALCRPRFADVTIVQFNDAGERIGKVTVAKVVKSDADWRKQLSPSLFQITRKHGTERPFSGAYWNLHDK